MKSTAARTLVPLLLLTVVVVITFSRPLHGPFVYDDTMAIVENETIRQLHPLSVPLHPPKDSPFAGRPLVNLSAAINYHFGELDPAGYRAVNLMFHALSAWLLFLLVRFTLQQTALVESESNTSDLLALGVALVWGVHPLQTETVCYTVQRTELMVGLFYLATMFFSARYLAALPGGPRTAWLAAAVLASVAGMLSKEVMVTAPVMVLIYDRAFINGSLKQCLRQAWPLYLGLALTWLPLAHLVAQGQRTESAGFHLGVSAIDYWLTQCQVLWMYVKLFFWPWPLSVHYEVPFLDGLGAAWMYFVPTALAIAVTLYALWRNWPSGVLGAWFFLILSPTLVVPIITEVAAERRMYLPLASLVIALVIGGYRYLAPASRRLATTTVVTVAVALVCATVSFIRVGEFADHLSFWSAVVARHPEFGLARFNLGYSLKQDGRLEEAALHYGEAVRIDPNDVDFRNNYGNTLRQLRRFPEAVEQLNAALESNPTMYLARLNLAMTYVDMGNREKALEQYERLVADFPEDAAAEMTLGTLLLEQGDPAGAVPHLQRAVELVPQDWTAWNNLGSANLRSGNTTEAIRCYGEVVRLDPESSVGHFNLADARARSGKLQQAFRDARRARELAVAQNQPQLIEIIDDWLSEHRVP